MKKILILLFVIVIVFITMGCTNKYIIEPNNDEVETSEDKEKTDNAENLDNNNNIENNSSKDNEKMLAPDFELESMDGTKLKLSDLKDKNVIINFWATWCGYCVLEMPDLQKLNDKYKDEDLIVLAVNVGETKETVQEFIEENELNLIVLLDEDSAVANNYGLRSFPSTLAVNKKGEIVTGYVGMMTYDLMEKLYEYFNQE
ncbi:MAG: TlpA disulfide reductase family protein [Tissierellia bacterium]|nr:TlpA disulfide reductase family protein [Tissierellia bacterium]